ncbi:hypothetical protein CVT25_014372 [Psilocybe cyanescens]|uniref:Uncharacterized protein n=1 Tax=Psilocybe cyanescens TaxID=93625 RepID=A0A409XPK4_PSICY|nr:hypothetical protein CVT25_014372 [Psilocybe cyanescens]
MPLHRQGAGVGAGTTTSNDTSSTHANKTDVDVDSPSSEERPVAEGVVVISWMEGIHVVVLVWR